MRGIIVPVMLFVAAACQPPPTELTEVEKNAIADEVNIVNAQWQDAWRDGDFGRGMSYYCNDPPSDPFPGDTDSRMTYLL